MRIQINKGKDVDKYFIQYVIKKLQEKILRDLNEKKLIPWDDFLAEFFRNNKFIKNPSAKEVIYLGCHHIRYVEFKRYYIVEIDPKVAYKNTVFSISTLCRLIDRGTLTQRGYPIFSTSFQYIEKNIRKLKKSYKTEGYLYAGIRII